jgi:ankyrin repeat protein
VPRDEFQLRQAERVAPDDRWTMAGDPRVAVSAVAALLARQGRAGDAFAIQTPPGSGLFAPAPGRAVAVNALGADHATPLLTSVRGGAPVETVRALLDAGAAPNALNHRRHTPAQEAGSRQAPEEVLRALRPTRASST